MRSTLYTNGSILTMEPGPRPEALLVTDGRIAALGGAATLSALAPDAERRDLAGGALLPAFLDAHSHITALAATMGLCDLSPSTSLHHMADILWTFEEDTDPPADGWILGFGYDHTALAERAHPTRQFFDAALPRRKERPGGRRQNPLRLPGGNCLPPGCGPGPGGAPGRPAGRAAAGPTDLSVPGHHAGAGRADRRG